MYAGPEHGEPHGETRMLDFILGVTKANRQL